MQTRLSYAPWYAAALVLALVGCTQERSDTKAPPGAAPKAQETKQSETVTLTWMGHWRGEHKREDLVREVAKAFEFRNPGVKVNLVFTEDIIGHKSHGDTAKYLAKMIRSGQIEWDVIWLDHTIYQEISIELGDRNWGKQYLVDFADVPGFRESHKDFIMEDPTYRSLSGGVFVGPYLEGFVAALYYNRDVAKKVGIEIPQFGMTYADLLAAVKTLHEYNQANGTNIYAFHDSRDRAMLFYIFDRLVKCELEDFEEVRQYKASAKKLAALKKAFQAFEELSKYKPLSAEYVEKPWYDTRALILDDKLLFFNDGTWMYSHWMTLGPDKISKIVPAESVTFSGDCNHYIGSYISTWGVLKNAKNRDLAIQFLSFWASPEFAEKWVRYTKNPTGLKGNLTESTLGSDPFEVFQAEIIKRYENRLDYSNLASLVLGEENSLLRSNIDVLTREVLLGQKTAEQAYAQLLASAKGLDNLIDGAAKH